VKSLFAATQPNVEFKEVNPLSVLIGRWRNTFLGALAVISLAKGKVEKGG
jgi:hypothetical protein